ncbi:hypothetical protein [Myroides pelagicus]|uniref:Lipoprotein n=1 Tax=Myroides pelagicus TaxID=270914 RepID=A0A7K1GIU4_9FLAO|nr:hypothetical protein [Myroides pelagicus]MEC4114465.1 hypothetical protein [Myroides pelagicus]MTH28746.1 hypothetical protein [Myroides pelagicus]
MKYLSLLIVIFVVLGCTDHNKNQQLKLSYYYWRTSYALDSVERKSLQDLSIDKMYMRYFDVVLKNHAAVPLSPIMFKERVDSTMALVPVVFIKNEVFLDSFVHPKKLASQVADFIIQINIKQNLKISEVQFDCDWSLSTKERFFAFVEEIKKNQPWKVSATIRLHQVKYADKTGIPKVDNGVLMYYNMGSIAADSLNSIYDRKIARQYISYLKDYSLPLNYALPIYSWLIHIREGHVVRLISRVRKEDINRNESFKLIEENRYLVAKEGEYFGQYFKQGDQVKVEQVTAQQLIEMKEDLIESSGSCPEEIILYDLNSKNIESYENEVFEELTICQ